MHRGDERITGFISSPLPGYRGRMAVKWVQKGRRDFSADDWRTFNIAFERWAEELSFDIDQFSSQQAGAAASPGR